MSTIRVNALAIAAQSVERGMVGHIAGRLARLAEAAEVR